MKLHIYESGTREQPAILFLHGSPLSGRMWQPQLDLLPDFHCLAPDLPEHGQSARIGPFEMNDTVRQLADLIRAASPDGRAHVVGLSFGGVVAQAMMVQTPEVVDHVILSGTAARLNSTLLTVLKIQIALNRPLMRWLSPTQLAALVRWQFGIPAQYSALLEDTKLVSPEAMMRFILATYADVVVPIQTHSPTLVLVGQKETPIAKMMARRLGRMIAGAKGALVPGVGHMWNLQSPSLFAETVRAWVGDSPLPDALCALAGK